MRIKNKINIAFIAAAFFTFVPAYAAEDISKTIAVVNNKVITSKDLDEQCALSYYQLSENKETVPHDPVEFKRKNMAKMIEDILILACAKKEKEEEIKNTKEEDKKKKLDVPVEWVEGKISEIISQYPSRDKFEESLAEKGLTVGMLRQRLKEQYMMQEAIYKHVRSRFSVSPGETLDYYDKHKTEFTKPARKLFVIAKSRNKNLLVEAARAIKNEGVEAAVKKSGGFLMNMEVDDSGLNEEISSVLKNMQDGTARFAEIKGVKHLIYLVKALPSSAAPFEEVGDRVYNFLWNNKYRDQLNRWLGELKENAVIKIYDDEYKGVEKYTGEQASNSTL